MATLSLKISVADKNVVKTMQFEPSLMVYDACRLIKDKITEANIGQPKDYGLFLTDEDPKKGVWLEPGRSLEYYLLRNGDLLEYRRKMRTLRVRMLDGSVKTVLVDDSQPVANLMVVICTKIGITNHDEYSLVRDFPEELRDATLSSTGTLTLRRKDKTKTLEKDKTLDSKMEQLKKKLKTDDDLNWVDHSKTLREQGIDEEETLLLRRKFFFSDQNIDSRDPVQLNLLYVQARDAIIAGTHPVTLEESCQFAGIQCQIQFGDYVESKHKPGFLDLKEFLPRDYSRRDKAIEKKVLAQHRQHIGESELEAKVKYVGLARSLSTYGVTFFLVKEKMKGKNKLVPRLLGVTKDSVLRLDEKTKEIMKTWPLTTVKRWAASPNSFTLDFGDYSDSYYSVQTTEGEQISQLIAGYIDIILRRKKAKDHFGIEGDEGSTMVEDSISPSKATILQHQPAQKPSQPIIEDLALPGIIRPGTNGQQTISIKEMPEQQLTSIQSRAPVQQSPLMTAQHPKYLQTGLSEPQRALHSTIGVGQDAVQKALKELETKAKIPEYGPDFGWKQNQLDVKKETVSSQMAALNAATAQVITLTSVPEDELDHPALGAAIHTISTNLPEMSRDVKVIAALMDDDDKGERLIDAARNLCSAFSELLKAAEPTNKASRQSLLNAASKVGEATTNLLYTIGEEDEYDREAADMLLSLSKPVANAAAHLVLKAKDVASRCDDQSAQNRVISSATQCALATSQLVACAKVVAPTISNPNCQQQIIEAAKEVAKSVENIVRVCQDSSTDTRLIGDLKGAAADVTQALNNLLNHVRSLSDNRGRRPTEHDASVDTILDATDRLFSSTGDATEMVRQAKILAQATAQLIHNIKGQAETQPDSDLQKRLLSAAKVLADATSRLVEAAKGCATNPHDSDSQAALKRAAEDLRNATNTAASNALKRKVITRLEASAKHATAMATQNIAAAHGCGPYNTNDTTQEELIQVCRDVSDIIPKVVQGIRGTQTEADNSSKQLQLINACDLFISPAQRLVFTSKSVIPTVTDQSSNIQLTQSSQQLAQALTDLQLNLSKAQDACSSSMEIDAAIESIRELDKELAECRKAAINYYLKPLPGENLEYCSSQLNTTCKSVGSSMAQLLTAASQGNENFTGHAGRDVSNALKNLTSAVRGVAATSNERDVQMRVIDNARDVLEKSILLFEETKWALHNPHDRERQQRLTQVAKSVSNSLNNCVNCLPGQRDVDESIRSITDATQLIGKELPVSHKSYSELQNNLTIAATKLNESVSDVIEGSRSPSSLANCSKQYSSAFNELFECGLEIAGQSKDYDNRSQMLSSLKTLSMCSSKLLVSAKSVSVDPNAPNARNLLASSARSVTESINNLVNVCSSSAPGQKECDSAIRNIQMMRSLLDNPSEPINDSTYFECLETVTERSRRLGDAMTGIANHAKKNEHKEFGYSVKDASDSICGLLEGAAQAAYLVGSSDPSSVAGRAGLVDINAFHKANEAIQSACQQLATRSSNKPEILSAATVIAKHTSALCNSCRVASSKTTNPVAKRHFVQSAKDVANATASLIKEIKTLDQDPSSEYNHNNCAEATKPLLEAVENLTVFASSPDFAPIPAKISVKARSSQEPITSYGKSIIDASCNMIIAAKSLALNPKDPPGWQTLANHSKNVSDSIKKLVTSIKDASPGQRECDEAVEKLSACIRELDQSSLNIISQNLESRQDNTLKGFREATSASATEIYEHIDAVRMSGKAEAEKLGHSVTQLVSYFDPLIQNAIGCASKTQNSKQQMNYLDQTKTITECALQLIYSVKECGGNSKASSVHAEIDESSESMKEALQDLLHTLESAATEAGQVTGIIESITKSITKIDERHYSYSTTSTLPSGSTYVDYQTRMVNCAKEIARIAQDMVGKSTTQVAHLSPLAANLSHNYANLANDVNGVIGATSNVEVANRIKGSVQELGTACIDITKSAGQCQANPGDSYSQRELTDNAKMVSEKVSYVLAALQAGSRGTQACINAASTVSGIIGDLDTTIMFAASGTLNAENENETFADHREAILKTAKALVEDTKTLVAGAASSQEQLAVAAQNAVTTIMQLSEVVKLGAASLGSTNSEAQVLLLNAVKDVATALGELIGSTKTASGKSINDPAMMYLKESAKVMVTNVTSLLKTVKTVEDEHQRGTRALESTIEAIGQEIRAFDSGEMPTVRKASPEDLVRVTKPVTLATAKAVAAGTSGKQDDVIVAANMGRKAIYDLLITTKAAANSAETHDLRTRVLESGRSCGYHYRELLQMVHQIISRPTPGSDAKSQLVIMSRTIATAVTEIVSSAELLKGSDWVDPDDPTVIAENELLGAASSIDAAAKKLASLQPRRTSIRLPHEEMNFDEMILEAAKSITVATAALVRAASAAQRELVLAGKVEGQPQYASDDGQWSDGLISAARHVAAATHSLVEAANALVQGQASEEKLISAAKQVAGSTAQLLVACKVKAGSDSQAMRRLQAAGNAVKKATDNLVRSAQQAIEHDDEQSILISTRRVPGIAQEIIAREEILKKERELVEAREKLATIHRAKYGNRPPDEYQGY
ncbi:unnamed protein product [Oppiella nova]|uniref:Talin n=1 Tax=Oppiella nova TaxID=334625 RepID=A0A7R9QF28_9ACAR|nr:unnamed protein product [Oppiella nova]CAG2163728.1 unnamed protein product [Oppiella nova]